MRYAKNSKLYTTLFDNEDYNSQTKFKEKIEFAIAIYVSSLNSTNSFYHQELKNKFQNFTSSQRNGMNLFLSNKLNCGQCHMGSLFTTATLTKNLDSVYKNIGLYNVKDSNKYPLNDAGLISNTKTPKHDGRFKVPSLLNVAITAPYMHDGSVASLSEVIDIYASGGRNITIGNFAGNGITNNNKDPLIKGFEITKQEKQDLINFLFTLSDTTFLANPLFQNPNKHLTNN